MDTTSTTTENDAGEGMPEGWTQPSGKPWRTIGEQVAALRAADRARQASAIRASVERSDWRTA